MQGMRATHKGTLNQLLDMDQPPMVFLQILPQILPFT